MIVETSLVGFIGSKDPLGPAIGSAAMDMRRAATW